ncbi:MAG: MBL fold metallo-hydrolase [Saprospiraceae bacterium]
MLISQSFQHEEILGFKFGYQAIGQPKLFTHIYFVDGLLLDTGQSIMKKSILAATKKLEVKQIFISHHHEDHTGNIRALKDQHNCEAYASKLCCEMMKAPPKLSFAQKITWGTRPAQKDLIPKQQAIKTNKYCFEIIPIFGHAPDMVALYEPNRKWLFSADLYLNSYIDYFVHNESVADQIASIKKILALDFDVLLCSHKPQLKNGKQQLTKKLHFLESFFDMVSTLYTQGYSAKEIFKHLKLKENWLVKILSGGSLSKMNMVHSVIRDLEEQRSKDFLT